MRKRKGDGAVPEEGAEEAEAGGREAREKGGDGGKGGIKRN